MNDGDKYAPLLEGFERDFERFALNCAYLERVRSQPAIQFDWDLEIDDGFEMQWFLEDESANTLAELDPGYVAGHNDLIRLATVELTPDRRR
jgi:hypothetical protein